MKIKKKIISAIMAITLGLSMTACGNSGTKSSGSKEIRISWWGSDNRHKAIQQAVAEFEKENPDIKVKAEYSGYSGYQEKLTTQLAGGTAADLIFVDPSWIDDYKNQLEDLNQYKEQLHLENFSKESLNSVERDGKLTGLPLSMNYRVIFYNKTLLDKYGIDVPKTWDEVFAAQKKLPKGSHLIYQYYSPSIANPVFLLTILAQQTGKTPIDANGKLQCTEAEWKSALEFSQKLEDEGVIPSMKEIDNSGGVSGAPNPKLMDGSWLGVHDYTSAIPTMAAQLKEGNYEMVAGNIPTMENQKSTGVWTKPAITYSIPKASKNKENALKLLEFLTNSKEAAKIQGIENGVPANKVQYEAVRKEGLVSPLVLDALKYGDENVDKNLANLYTFEDVKTQELFSDQVSKLGYGKATIADAAKVIQNYFKEKSQ